MSDHASTPGTGDGLHLTGERTLPGIWQENYWYQRHVVAYQHASARVRDLGPEATVLDAGCGEGYGLALLADAGAGRVVGVDLDRQVTRHAEQRYASSHPTIEVVTAELRQLPLSDDEVDLVVSFQVIEHLHDIPGYLQSLLRVTRPGGQVLIATPNRLTFTPGRRSPVNPFHTREFTAPELVEEVRAAGLEVEELLGVHHGRRLAAVDRLARRPLPVVLAAQPADAWPRWIQEVVRRVDPSWFRVEADEVDASLDLVIMCRVPGR